MRNKNLRVTRTVITEKGNEFDVSLPAKRIVCTRCDGSGFHVNPSIDGHGLSSDDFDQDPDFREAYFSGQYDVECYECKGERVVLEVDWDQLSSKMQKRYQRALDQEYRNHLERERALRWGW